MTRPSKLFRRTLGPKAKWSLLHVKTGFIETPKQFHGEN